MEFHEKLQELRKNRGLSPTERWGTKTEYTKLRKFLHKDGYIRIAPEVFMRNM